jgi:aspartate carbamoyltransferase catalytic subunit
VLHCQLCLGARDLRHGPQRQLVAPRHSDYLELARAGVRVRRLQAADQLTAKDQPARLVEGQRVMGRREALNELDVAYLGRLRQEQLKEIIQKSLHK